MGDRPATIGTAHFGMHYWMFDVDMDCEQAFDDGQGHRWFELKAFMVTQLMTAVAPTPGWERDVNQTSNPMPPLCRTTTWVCVG